MKKRQANIELLKIVNMLMVVGIHYIRESGSLLTLEAESLSGRYALAMFFEVLFIVMIDAYVFISGYYGINGKFKVSKLISYQCRLWFYTLLIPIVLMLFGVPTLVQTEGVYGLFKYLFPIGNSHYWFMTAYFYMMLFMPFINLAVKTLEKKQLLLITACFLAVFCGVKSLVPLRFSMDNGGYELLWLLCVYLLAACMRMYGGKLEEWFDRHALKIYLGSATLSFLIMMGAWFINKKTSGVAYLFMMPIHHNFILCLVGAMGLFYTFRKMQIKEGKTAELIRRLATYSLGVYLLHEHLDLRTRWCPALTDFLKPVLGEGVLFFLVGLILCVAVMFAAGVTLDFVREKLFGFIYKRIAGTRLVKAVYRLDDIFSKKEGDAGGK